MSRLEELITFVEVVNAGSITKAAARMGIVKSAVSRRLTELEDRLKVRLLVRSTAGLSVTEAGMGLFARASRIIADLDDAELTVTNASAQLFGTLRMTAPVSLTNQVLMPHINDFLVQHPGLTFDLYLSDRPVDIVNEGFDIAIRAGTLSDSSLVARKLTEMPRVTCASPNYLALKGEPKTPHDLMGHEGLVSSNVPESLYWKYLLPDGGIFQAHPGTRLRTNNGESVISATVAGLGISALPAFLSRDLIASGDLRQILSDYPLTAGGLYAIYPPGRHLSHRVRVLIDFLVERFNTESPK